ncbi:MAG: ABC transporter ATP-binding protein [Candidatus Verstraetearchaeota archaeon]|nr:ABC transporter ATP-binding protein [Candidatus Verstraetearchaeota archaeon]
MSSPSIETIGLTKHYNSFVALSDLNLRLDGSKCVGFLGPNGAGKTTTLKILTALIQPSAGTAMINGVDIMKDKKGALAQCGVLVETPEIYPSLKVGEALSMLAELKGVPRSLLKDEVYRVLSEVKMEEWIDSKAGKLSKGMKQRVNLAAALISDPIILILDEPSTGLDPRGMAEVRNVVKGLKKKNRLIFMSSHLLSEVTEICDEVAIIDRGRLVAYDTIENLTSTLMGKTKICEAVFSKEVGEEDVKKVNLIEGVTKVERAEPRRLLLELEGGEGVQEDVLAKIAALRVGLIGFKPHSSALEETYLRLVKGSG